MNKTGKFLNPRNGGVNGIPSWRKIAQQAELNEQNRRALYGQNVPDKKQAIDAILAKKTDEKLSGTVTAENITSDLLTLWGEL